MAVTVRTAGAKRTKTEITRDFNYLSKLWDDIRAHHGIAGPCMIHEEVIWSKDPSVIFTRAKKRCWLRVNKPTKLPATR